MQSKLSRTQQFEIIIVINFFVNKQIGQPVL